MSGMMIAWIVSLVASLSALFIGEVMGQMPCVLCWYQRIAMFPIAVILAIGLLRNDPAAVIYALPFALAGTLIALWHSLLYAEFIPRAIEPCTATGPSCSGADQVLLGVVSLPYVSAVAFALVTIALAHGLIRKVRS